MYEKGMLMRAHKRKIAEKSWRENAIEKGRDEVEDFEESKKNEKALLANYAKTNEKAAKIQAQEDLIRKAAEREERRH